MVIPKPMIDPIPVRPNFQPVDPLDADQLATMTDLEQQKAAIRQVMADAQSDYAAAQMVYEQAINDAVAAAQPAYQDAAAVCGGINNKCNIALQDIEEQQRAIRSMQLAPNIDM